MTFSVYAVKIIINSLGEHNFMKSDNNHILLLIRGTVTLLTIPTGGGCSVRYFKNVALDLKLGIAALQIQPVLRVGIEPRILDFESGMHLYHSTKLPPISLLVYRRNHICHSLDKLA